MEKKDNVEKGVSGKPEKKKSAAYYEKRPEFGNRGPSKILLHFRKGITFFLVIAACVIFYFLLLRIEDISVGVSKVIDVLKPILYGMVIAYLLNPIVKQIDRWLIPQLKKKMSQEKAKKVSRSVGVFAALVMLLALILALCNMLIPELYKSIRDMVQTLPGQISDMVTKIISIQKDTSPAGVMARNLLEKGSDALQNWIKQDLLTKVNEVMSNLTVGIINFVSEILNFLIGLIVSVYILFSKETFSAQSKKIVYAVFRTDHANMILHLTKKSNEIFGGFIIGKIIDSMIIGVLCFFGLTLLKMPYILLISVIVGVTNVIPFFGPYIGAIPSAVLILLNDPIKGLYFLIFILVLQQLDGNVIGPKILGNSTGLSAFWVVFSILLGGGLFGFVGMIMGVPTFAVVYYIITMLINHLLEKKKLPLQTSEYGEKSYVDDSGRFVRENPDIVKQNIKNKFQDDKLPLVDEVIELDQRNREIKQEVEALRADKNQISKQIGACMAQGKKEEAEELKKKVQENAERVEALSKEEKEVEAKIKQNMMIIPNIIDPSVPIGKDDSENVEIEKFGEPVVPDYEIPYHTDIMESFNGIDLESAGKVAGNGFYYLMGDIARLHSAVISYARDFMIDRGFTYCIPPFMIRSNVVTGVMSFEEMDAMMYKIEGEDLYLIGTSEHSMIGKFIDTMLTEDQLPQTLTSYSPCFRKEKGAHGIEERGVYRIHQFEKQEMIVVCKPEESKMWYDKLWQNTVDLFRSMDIPVRTLECCSGDLADLKVKSCDVEAWSPRQKKYFEVGSCSNLGDAQARRLGIRVKDADGNKYFANTLNNTVVAPPRMLIAFLENNLQADGSVRIPEVLRPYMGGMTEIKRK